MLDRLRRLLRDLSGASDEQLIDLLLRQVDCTLEGARVAREAASDRSAAEARERMRDIERDGDGTRGQLVELLARSLVTPIDREDLFRVSRSVDDVLDNLRDFIRELDLYRLDGDASFAPVVDAVIEGITALRDAVSQLNAAPDDVSASTLSAKKAGSRVRRLYQEAVADLLNDGEFDRTLLKRRELLRRLDVVGLRLGESADALADAVLKRGY